VSQYQKNIHSLAPCLCEYYTTSLINFLHFLYNYARKVLWTKHLPCIVVVRSDNLFYNLTPRFLWLTSRIYTFHFIILAFFAQSFLSFLKTCPYHVNPCHSIPVIISSIPSLSFNSILENLSASLMPHIQLIILISALVKCQLVFFLRWPRFTAM